MTARDLHGLNEWHAPETGAHCRFIMDAVREELVAVPKAPTWLDLV